jgi:hypothetical protein
LLVTTTLVWAGFVLFLPAKDPIRGKPIEHRLAIRQSRAKPLLDDLRK